MEASSTTCASETEMLPVKKNPKHFGDPGTTLTGALGKLNHNTSKVARL